MRVNGTSLVIGALVAAMSVSVVLAAGWRPLPAGSVGSPSFLEASL
jgi:hypothetical protein